jgi:hypothetical protein
MKKKRAQIQLSFSMIFSIILVIATLAVAFYVIKTFVIGSKCTKIQLFYNDLENEIDEVWRSGSARQTYKVGLPTGIEEICFGEINQLKEKYPNEYKALSKYSLLQKNLFIYPTQKSCDSSVSYRKLEHVNIKESFCVPVKKGELSIVLIKGSNDSLVTLCKEGEPC